MMLRNATRMATVTVVAAAAVVFAAAPALAAPVYKLPFPCGEAWSGETRTNHSPLNGIDFNRANDEDDWVIASAPGTVDVVADLGSSSYGKYIRITHTTGHTTYYAHLKTQQVSVGTVVGYGTWIGTVGSTGNSSGPHLHYEQRVNGTAQQVAFDGVAGLYYGSRGYTSSNACGGTSRTGAGWIDTASSGPQLAHQLPTRQSTAVASYSDGTYVVIWCQAVGETITGKWGTNNIWNRIATGQFVPDVNVYTGYAAGWIPGVPRC